MIAVVGSRKDEFHFDDGLTKVRVYHDDDPQSTLYNEMCGHRHLLTNWETYSKDEYCGLEHYRRAFDLTPEQIKNVLKDHEVIVKEMHGPYGDNTNLTVLSGCSRYGINYYPQASAWAVTSSVITSWSRRHDREQGIVSLDVPGDGGNWADSFAANEVPHLLTDGETRELANDRRKKPRSEMNPRARKVLEMREYNDAVAYAYDDYVAECEMLGVAPIGRDEYLSKNFKNPC